MEYINFFEEEMRKMFDHRPVVFRDRVYADKTMLAKLGHEDHLLAKVQFISTDVRGQYDALQLTIINRAEGVVDKQNFEFNNIVGPYLRAGKTPVSQHIWEHSYSASWFTPFTDEDRQMVANAVTNYAKMFLSDKHTA